LKRGKDGKYGDKKYIDECLEEFIEWLMDILNIAATEKSKLIIDFKSKITDKRISHFRTALRYIKVADWQKLGFDEEGAKTITEIVNK